MSLPETSQDRVRDILVRVTGFIPNETLAGLAFGVALITTDHIFNLTGVIK